MWKENNSQTECLAFSFLCIHTVAKTDTPVPPLQSLMSYSVGPLSCSLRKDLFSLIRYSFFSYYNHLLSSEADTADERCCSSSSVVATLLPLSDPTIAARDINDKLHHSLWTKMSDSYHKVRDKTLWFAWRDCNRCSMISRTHSAQAVSLRKSSRAVAHQAPAPKTNWNVSAAVAKKVKVQLQVHCQLFLKI